MYQSNYITFLRDEQMRLAQLSRRLDRIERQANELTKAIKINILEVMKNETQTTQPKNSTIDLSTI